MATIIDRSGASPGKLRLSYVMVLFILVSISNYADRFALAALAPLIKRDLAISDAQLGALTGIAFSLFYALCGIPLARLADRVDRRKLLAVALATWSGMTALCGAATGFWQMMLARFGVGVGEAGCSPTTQTMVCDLFPLEKRPFAFAMIGMGSFVGWGVGFGVAGSLGEIIGWRWTFVALGAPGIFLAALVWTTLRDPPRLGFDPNAGNDQHLSLKEVVAMVARCPSYLLLGVFSILNGFAMSGFGQWWPSFFGRVHLMSSATAGIYLGLVVMVGSGLGVVLGGLVSSKLAEKNRMMLIWVGVVMIGCAIPAAFASIIVQSANFSLALVLVVSICWSVPNGALMTAIYAVTPLKGRATAAALIFFLTAIIGAGFGPLVVGIVSDTLAGSYGTQSLRWALLVPASALVGMFIVLCLLTRHFHRDLERKW